MAPGKVQIPPSLAEVSAPPGWTGLQLQNMFFCETCAAVGGRVEPVGRTCAANVGESELASLSDQGVEGVPNNLPMPD